MEEDRPTGWTALIHTGEAMDLEHDKAARRLERQLAKGRHAAARITFLWLMGNGGDRGMRGVVLRRILRNALASDFLEYLRALGLVAGFLWPRKGRAGLVRLGELAEAGERGAILFLAGRLARHELRGGRVGWKVKVRACAWLASIAQDGDREALALTTLLTPLPTVEEVMAQPFPFACLDELSKRRRKAERHLERLRRKRCDRPQAVEAHPDEQDLTADPAKEVHDA